MKPYSVVENKGFQHMINVLEPRYDLPSRVHFSEKVIPKLYKEVKGQGTLCLLRGHVCIVTM